jgi:hypothetical protein
MADETESGLVLEYALSGRGGKATVTARLNGEPVAVDSFDLTKPKARTEFAKTVCDRRPGIDPDAVGAQLLRLAADAAKRGTGNATPDVAALPEIDTSAIVRPERFIVPEVSGLTVPTMTVIGDKPEGRWLLYLRWADGRRERRPLATAIEVPKRRKLWIHPEPAAPTATMQCGWSLPARRTWLEGAEAPSPTEVFRRVCERVAYFIDLPVEHAKGTVSTLALWVLLTYCYQAWPAVPYLFVSGPLGSGKSRVFEILARVVFRALSSSNMTAAALFRTLHNYGGTLLLDEAERLRQTTTPDVGEILSMLLAGYKRGGQATRLEPIGDNGFKTVGFDVFGPKALACIAGLPPPLASRCIAVPMFRAAPRSEKPRRRIDADPGGWQRLRDDLHALALDHGPTWLELAERTDVCPAMSGRDFELWQPLLALASWVESHGAQGLHGLLQEHALAAIDRSRDEAVPDADETLLRILADAVRIGDRPTPHDVLAKAMEAEPVVFKGWHPRTVTARLKSYGIPTPRKIGSRREFREVPPDVMRRIQANYSIDLEFPDDGEPATAEPSQSSLPSHDG